AIRAIRAWITGGRFVGEGAETRAGELLLETERAGGELLVTAKLGILGIRTPASGSLLAAADAICSAMTPTNTRQTMRRIGSARSGMACLRSFPLVVIEDHNRNRHFESARLGWI